MFIEQEEIDRLADEATLLHMIIGYPTLTMHKFKPIEPIEEGKPMPDSHIKMDTFEIQWHNLEFKYRKELVERYLALQQDNIDYIDHFIPKYKNRATIATITALTMLAVNGILLIAIITNWR